MGYSPRGRKESDTTEGLHFHFHPNFCDDYVMILFFNFIKPVLPTIKYILFFKCLMNGIILYVVFDNRLLSLAVGLVKFSVAIHIAINHLFSLCEEAITCVHSIIEGNFIVPSFLMTVKSTALCIIYGSPGTSVEGFLGFIPRPRIPGQSIPASLLY